ncbi:MAG: hypothetical protein QM754_07250 [Tepidisphaeraceae bacterium]
MVNKLSEEQIKYIETLLPELRARTEKSFELGAKLTGKPVESFGKLPDLTVNRAPEPAAKKPAARRKPAASKA